MLEGSRLCGKETSSPKPESGERWTPFGRWDRALGSLQSRAASNPGRTEEGASRMRGKTSLVRSFKTETRTTGALLLTLLLITVLIGPGATSHNPHQPANLTWVIYNPETGEVLNLSSNVAPKGTWWPVLTFDLCMLAADGNGSGPYQLTKFFAHGSFGLFTHNCERKGPQYYAKVPVYVCPGKGRDRNQIEECGRVDSFYFTTWGCETTEQSIGSLTSTRTSFR